MQTIVVVPTYNEASNIDALLRQILSVLPDSKVIVVDDSSPDGTAEIVRQLKADDERLDLWQRPRKLGLGSAYIDAFRRLLALSDADLVCTIDADFSHDPRLLCTLVDAAATADVVVGSRYVDGGRIAGWSVVRRAISRAGNIYARVVARVPVRDLTSGFVCFRRDVLSRIPLDSVHSSGYAYTIESKCLAYRAGARVTEVPIAFVERRSGQSKFNAQIIVEGLIAPWSMRRAQRGPNSDSPVRGDGASHRRRSDRRA